MEVLAVPSITETEVCLTRFREADFDAFSHKIQQTINEAKYYATENGKDSDCSLANVLNNIKNTLSLSRPNPKRSSHSKQPAVSWEMKRMRELEQKLPELAAFKLHKKIGSGTFSIVYLASLKANPQRLFALKHHIPTTSPNRIENELKCLRDIGGQDNVVGVDICLRNKDCIVFVMPYINQVRIHDFVKDIDVAETRDYLRGLLVALRRVHSFNIIHRDVKPSNFLYDRANKKYLLIDFGLANKGYQPFNETKQPSLENNKKRRHDDDCYELESSHLNNPPKRMALQTIQNENGFRSPNLHSNQQPNQAENCPPADTGKVDIRVNEVKKRLFANDLSVVNTYLDQIKLPGNHKSPIVRPKKISRVNKVSDGRKPPTAFYPQSRIDWGNQGTPEKYLFGKQVYVPHVDAETVTNKHGEFVAPKKNSDLVRKSMTPEESGKVVPTAKARKMLMPYKNNRLIVRKPSTAGNGFLPKEKLCTNESNGLLSASPDAESVLNGPKQQSILMAPKVMDNCGGSVRPRIPRTTIMSTPKVTGYLKETTPLMAPKENRPVQKKKLFQNQTSAISQTPRVSGLQQFQTLTSCEKGGTSLRVQDSQVKEVRKETFVSPPNLSSTCCSCFGKSRVCDLCLKRKTMVASRAGTPGFRPPEVLLKYSNQTTAVDIWAAGVIMLSLVSGCYPFFRSPSDIAALTELTTLFGSKKFQEVAKKLGRQVTVSQVKKPLNLRKLCEALRRRTSSPRPSDGAETCFDCRQTIDKVQGCICETDDDRDSEQQQQQQQHGLFPPSAYDLLSRLLDLNPETRITAAEALEHPFIKGE